ncbi:hypothetical protein ACT3TY_17485 [Halomonas sp. AOP22-C1-8]|uniref:hypothetical protein n=1 Tax=Halomonas sp. AOP22-C1-8 TaxID=3457717 RepID=UPI00403316E5
MDWLKKIFRKKASTETVPAVQTENEATYEPDPEMQRKLEEGCAAKDAVYARLGELDDDVLAPLVNPSFMGGPCWPSLRQSWRVIRKPSSTIVASDGLSDPFEDERIPLGFKIEVCAEAPEAFENVAGSWLFELVYQVSQLVAQHGQVYELLQKYQSLSTVVDVDGVPEEYQNEDRCLST